MNNTFQSNNAFLASHTDYDDKLTKLTHEFSSEMFEYVRSKIFQLDNILEASFQLELIVDTNVLFSEVRSLMLNGKSFFQTISANPFLKVYAPSQLREELHAKIRLKFPKEKKTRDLDIDKCIESADLLLSKISINDDFGGDSWDKAKSYLEDRDRDDISFVALNIALKKDGILTSDRDISDQPEIKTWNLRDTGAVLTQITKGAFSFVVSNASLRKIFKILHAVSALVWKSFLDLCKNIINAFSLLANKGMQSLSSTKGIVLGGIGAFLLYQNRENLSGFWTSFKTGLKEIISFFKMVWEALQKFYELLRPYLAISYDLLSFFISQSTSAIEMLKKMESERMI